MRVAVKGCHVAQTKHADAKCTELIYGDAFVLQRVNDLDLRFTSKFLHMFTWRLLCSFNQRDRFFQHEEPQDTTHFYDHDNVLPEYYIDE